MKIEERTLTRMEKQAQKDEVVAAFRWFAQAVNAGRKGESEMSPLVEATSRLSLSQMESWERCLRRELHNTQHQPTSLTWLDLCSGDGYIREETLNALSGAAPNRFFLALALRRLNDWVPQVRAAARKQLPLIANASDPEQVVDVLCATLPHWDSWGRMEDADKQVILELISPEKVLIALKFRLISSKSGPMTTILVQACRTPALDPYLAEIAHRAIQPAVRAKVYRLQLSRKNVWFEGKKWEWTNLRDCKGRFKPIHFERALSVDSPFLETLKLAATDPSPMVRRVAGEMLIRELNTISAETGADVRNLAELLASDTSVSVAEQGKFVLKRLFQC
ncbi:MAG: hypothetical protein IV090_20655 [Candidatus Sericytochromatia bacterium]|nr:hypothetical protein [Candidatus Sericytochromatia bacterium]